MADNPRESNMSRVKDPAIRKYLYLDLSLDELIAKMGALKLHDFGVGKDVPFTASIRGYKGATDGDGDSWLVKPIPPAELVDHKFQEAAYYIDFALGTVAAPNIVTTVEAESYRITKTVRSALQISSYEYSNEPFKSVLANDLLNRWLFFDEDRNPNNYLVLHDTDRTPCIVVIDYNKADLRSAEMKITGNDEKFGWHRLEKTRFLTLLKPENFDNLSLTVFEERLVALESLTEARLKSIGLKTFKATRGTADQAVELAATLARTMSARRNYIVAYFRKWFKIRDAQEQKDEDERYAGFGQSFMDYYKKKM